MEKQNINNMEIHATIHISYGGYVLRVPGGWIYYKSNELKDGQERWISTFVPISKGK